MAESFHHSATPLPGTPAADGFAMPGEFRRHRGCWLAWPERPDNWRQQAAPAQRAFAAVAAAIARFEPVTVVASAAQQANARALLPAGVRLLTWASDDAWMRDIGPSFVTDGRGGLRAVDWQFNAWGGALNGLYAPWDRDDATAGFVASAERAPRYRAPLVMEGGAFHVDGEGTLITTAECLLDPGRNPELTQAQIEQALKDYLGVAKVIWLPRGVVADETHGHVDNLLHYVGPAQVCLTWTDDPDDPQYERSREAEALLLESSDAQGRRLRVTRLPQPGPLTLSAEEAAGIAPGAGGMSRHPGDRLAASYCNFYLANDAVIYPLLDPRHDERAGDILARLLPERTVIGVPAREILLGGGNIHCITQQVPG